MDTRWIIRAALLVPLTACVAGAGGPPVTSAFGAFEYFREDPHRGTDYGVPIGTPVLAVADGILNYAGHSANRTMEGNNVTIQHTENLSTKYMHLSVILVKRDELIKRGEVIALSGDTGNRAMTPHLHFQVNRAEHVNPYPEFWYGGHGNPLAPIIHGGHRI